MRFPASLLDEIRNRLPLSQVVGRRVTWDRRKTAAAKGDYWACCPFHGEKSPSFHADDRKGIYHCFGCGVTGDHFRFLTELEGLSFPEAVERLAAEAGVPLPAPDPAAGERDKRRASLHEVMEMATAFFEEQLRSPAGAAARAYLDGRRLTPDIRHTFRLGYAPNSRSALKTHLAGKGVDQALMAEAGLLITGDDIAVSFDRFRDRVIFPIHDLRGRIVAFGGRALSAEAQAKYLNSPETPLFQKGHLLYRGHVARAAAPQAGTVIAVEGYVDVIAMATAGFANTVAPLGTALTEDQLRLLWRMAPEPILCFDGDPAGLRAAFRAIDLALPALKPGYSLRFALLPEGMDPDDLVGAGGPPAVQQVLDAALPLVDMLWRRESEAGGLDTPERRAGLDQRLRAAADAIADPGVRRHYRQALEERAAAFFAAPAPEPDAGAPSGRGPRRAPRGAPGDWQTAQSRGPTVRRHIPPPPVQVSRELLQRSSTGDAAPRLSEAVLVLTMATHPALLARHLDDFAHIELAHRQLGALRAVLLDAVGGDPDLAPEALSALLAGRGFAPLLQRLERQVGGAGIWQALAAADDESAGRGWLQALILHRRSRALHKELRQAEVELVEALERDKDSLQRLTEVQQELASADGIEAAVEGFGRDSGRSRGTI